jgi:succinyl-CoA synthetase beta subunit
MGITFDPQRSLPVIMVSARGGVDIESLAQISPQDIITQSLDPTRTMRLYHTLALMSEAGLTGNELLASSRILLCLLSCYYRYEAITAEINPLVRNEDGNFFAADAKFEIDDSALFRLVEAKDFKRDEARMDPLEAEARAAGVSYVRMNRGNIGLISGGAGLGMATMDAITNHGGVPANFLDLGGDATPEKTAAALKIVLKTPGVEGVLLNVFGGINNCEQMAKGIAKVIDEMNPKQTITVKMRGHSQEAGWTLLEARQVPVIKYGTTEAAVVVLLEEMKRRRLR